MRVFTEKERKNILTLCECILSQLSRCIIVDAYLFKDAKYSISDRARRRGIYLLRRDC